MKKSLVINNFLVYFSSNLLEFFYYYKIEIIFFIYIYIYIYFLKCENNHIIRQGRKFNGVAKFFFKLTTFFI